MLPGAKVNITGAKKARASNGVMTSGRRRVKRASDNARLTSLKAPIMNMSLPFIERPVMTTLVMAAHGDLRRVTAMPTCRSANCPMWIFPPSR